MQEIAPFLRVLGCYPMDLDAGDGHESASAERQPSGNGNGASGPPESTSAEDALLLSGAAFQRKAGSQVRTQALAATLLLDGHLLH